MRYKLCILLLLLLLVTGCKEKEEVKKQENISNVTITLEEYKQLEKGMDIEEVTNIIGGECAINNNSNEYYCSGDFAGTYAILTFEDNVLKEMEAIGLQ